MDNRDTSNEIKPSLIREYEFFGGCIRVKISVKNTSSLAVLDAALELESDERILHFDRCEPEYPEKKGKIVLGNINPNTDRTVAFYLDPLICAKEGTDVNCRVSFKDAFGRPDSVQMEPLKIKVVCPIFRTEQDVNIGRLKELVSGLQFHDSKVYIIPKKLEISELLGTCRNVIQLHDVRHIKTFKTTDEKTYEAWYYGKTKVMKKDLVIKCAICKDTESIEVLASGNDPADITGLLAEIGRNLTKEFERLGKAQPVFNIHIKDSIIQRSNLLSFCNMDGTCGGDVVIEDSVVQRANIASWNEAGEKERGEAQKREREEQESLRRLKEHEERAQRERKAREETERMESERQKAKQEEERIEKERAELSDVEKKTGFSQIKFLAVALVLGVLLIGYWTMAPYTKIAPGTVKSTLSTTPIPILTPTVVATTVQVSTNIIVDQVLGNRSNSSSSTLDNGLQIRLKPDVGTTSIDLRQVIITVWDQDYHYDLNYSSTGTANLTFTASAVRDEDRSFSAATPVLNSGDLVTVYVTQTNMPGISLTTRKTFWLSLNQELGSPVNLELTTPNSFGIYKFVQLYP
jgi:archaellin